MEYEIHVTVKQDSDAFLFDCQEIGIKPILIQTEKDSKYKNQVMTSSKHKDDNWRETLSDIVKKLKDKGHEVIREKVEIKPAFEKNENHIYYESHLRLKLVKGFDRTELKNWCKVFDFHLSKNLFKWDKEFDYQMITYRKNYTSLDNFTAFVKLMQEKLFMLGIEFDKVEIEECVYDSNIEVDKDWL